MPNPRPPPPEPEPEPEPGTASDLRALLLRVVRAADLGLLLSEDADWIRAQIQATTRVPSPKPAQARPAQSSRPEAGDSPTAARQTPPDDTRRPITPGSLCSACTRDSGGALVVHVAGDIDPGTAPALRACLTSQLHAHLPAPVLVVELDAVDFLSCAGLTVLLDAHHDAAAHGTTLRLAHCSPAVRRLLDLVDHHTRIPAYLTIEDALH